MNYYVIQVLTRSEAKFIRLADNLLFGARREGSQAAVPPWGAAGTHPPIGAGKGDFAAGSEPASDAASDFAHLPGGFSPDAPLGRLVWPRRKLTIRRKGVQQESLAPIFPGYLFYEAEGIRPDVYWALRRISGFIRFLKNEGNLEVLGGRDRELLLHFLSYGEVVAKSLVYFDEDRRIRVKSGPMKGLEGRIVKVDKRKGRAKVRLSLYSDRFLVDFGFELLESTEGNERSAQ